MSPSRSARFGSFSTVLLATMAIATPAIGQDKPQDAPKPKHMVRFSFKEGAVRHSVVVQDVVIKMNMGGEDMVTNLKTTTWITTKLTGTKGNTAHIEQVITRVKAFADGMAMKVNYDSDIEDSDPGTLNSVADMLNQKIRFKMTDLGKVSDVVLPKTADDAMRTASGMQQSLLQGLTRLPGHPLAIGDKWQSKEETAMAMFSSKAMMTHTAHELLAVDKQSITVKQTQTIDPDADELPGAMNPANISIVGTYKLDLRTGIPIEATTLTTSKLTGPVKMDMSVKQTVKPAPAAKPKKAAKKHKEDAARPGK